MTNEQMIAAILSSIQTQSNLLILMQAMIADNIANASTTDLQAMCQALGIPTS